MKSGLSIVWSMTPFSLVGGARCLRDSSAWPLSRFGRKRGLRNELSIMTLGGYDKAFHGRSKPEGTKANACGRFDSPLVSHGYRSQRLVHQPRTLRKCFAIVGVENVP